MKLSGKLTALFALGVLLSACDSSKKNVDIPTKMPAYVVQKGNSYFISQWDMRVEIMANVAGRIASLKVAGQEILFTPNLTATSFWGNVFWTSPQSEWNWPPSETLDAAPYSVSFENDRILFTSQIDKKTGYQFIKSYGLNTYKKCLSIRYTIYNRSSVEKTLAPWEVTRLLPTGTAFFPQGNTESTSGIFYPVPVEHIGNITWATYDSRKILDNHHKLITDGKEGWLAYVNKDKLFVKEFADVPVELMIPGEGEIELFANTEKTSWEVDEQGPMATVKSGESLSWEVLWHVRKLPDDIGAVQGNDKLVDFVRGVVAGRN